MIALCRRDHLHDSGEEAAACDRLAGVPVVPGRARAPWPPAEDTRRCRSGRDVPVWVWVGVLLWAVAFTVCLITAHQAAGPTPAASFIAPTATAAP